MMEHKEIEGTNVILITDWDFDYETMEVGDKIIVLLSFHPP